jgi:4-methylaminobutanoate oxidase (formaldehyde-forming)
VRRGGGFVGAESLREPARRLRCLTLADPRAVALGGEPVRVGDTVVAQVTSGGYGYTVRSRSRTPTCPWRRPARSRWRWTATGSPREVAAGVLYDPKGSRIRL